MLDEPALKDLILEHCWRVNDRDIEGLLRLYSPDVRFEDPVGSGMRYGREALRAHGNSALASNAVEIPGTPVANRNSQQAIVPIAATMDYLPLGPSLTRMGILPTPRRPVGQRMRCHFIMLVRAGADGLIEEMQGIWGRTDVALVDDAAPGPAVR
ncbi:nuclear transport factor 2 family protein [Streptomyces litchfieldiae]|uniref:Nuclear transport factor 2 family protein n=1 Tax=Streptomyces litchfieldiae TaxID=3075543 RepID=A0ABU2MQT8_9ACTN|nr:nuclear transport factor 2 family protein [Streptomyces sp. DSM 44938]MDT0343454.1 nuclear transport factor 2 family protein [Streptomyces sp. DSM 44938]